MKPLDKRIAYFSMEIALDPAMPIYGGGLGVLAGDTLRAAADHALPMVVVTLLHRQGYLRQKSIRAAGRSRNRMHGRSSNVSERCQRARLFRSNDAPFTLGSQHVSPERFDL